MVLILVSVALQLDPGMQRIAQVTLKRGDDALLGQMFEMTDTERLSNNRPMLSSCLFEFMVLEIVPNRAGLCP